MNRYSWYDGNNPNIPENSVGVLPISGPIFKYNVECGPPGAISKNTDLLKMQKRANIGSIVMLMDTPGGQVNAKNDLISSITRSNKPILSYVNGMSASLGVFFTSASEEVWLSNKEDQIGSVGSYVMLADMTGKLEKDGIKLHEIYAPQSVDKNKDVRDALNGDYAAIEKELENHVNDFISFVKDQRGEKAANSVKEWSTGKMFNANDAIKMGLADRIGTFDQVVSKASWLAKRKKQSTY